MLPRDPSKTGRKRLTVGGDLGEARTSPDDVPSYSFADGTFELSDLGEGPAPSRCFLEVFSPVASGERQARCAFAPSHGRRKATGRASQTTQLSWAIQAGAAPVNSG